MEIREIEAFLALAGELHDRRVALQQGYGGILERCLGGGLVGAA